MENLISIILENELYRKLGLTILVILGQALFRRVINLYIINRFSQDSPHVYTVRKVSGYLITFLSALLIFAVWAQQLNDLSIAFGIFAAGLAFALQEIIGSIAGWITIVFGKPFTVGDRIETGGIQGDVVDIGVLRTKVMEIGNWLGGDHNTGRIVTVSNAFIFKEPLYNYSLYLNYIWDEIIIPITYDSDWKKAMEIMSAAVLDHPAYQTLLPKAEKQHQMARRKLAVKITPLEPRLYLKLTDNWIELGLVYPVEIDIRRSFRSETSQKILTRFKEEDISMASQTIAIVEFPEGRTSRN